MQDSNIHKFDASLIDLIDEIDDAVFIKDINGSYTYCNHAAAKLLGREVKYILGKKDSDLFTVEDCQHIHDADQQVIDTKQTISLQSQYHIHGKTYWFQTILSAAFQPAGVFAGIIGISRDVTEHIELMEQVKEYSENLEIILDNSEDAIYRKDMQGRYVFINPAGEKLMGKSHDLVINHTDIELFDEKIAKKIRKTDRDVINKNTSMKSTIRYPGDGKDRWFNISVSPAHTKESNLLGVVGISKDITDIKELELKLRETNEQLTTILESTSDAIYAKDLSGKYIFINSSGAEFLNRRVSEIVGYSDVEIFDEETYQIIYAIDQQVIQEKKATSVDNCFGQKGHEIWYHTTVTPSFSSEGDLIGVIGISRNMTDYYQTQEKLWKTENRYYALYNDTPAMILTVGPEGNIIEANTFAANKLGYTIKELSNSSIYTYVPPQDRNTLRKHIQEAVDSPGCVYKVERQYLTKTGDTVWSKDFMRTVFTGQDATQNIIILSEDITRTHELSEKLLYSEAHDSLTSLLNRSGFMKELDRAIQVAHEKHLEHLLYILDVDGFMVVNDVCGYGKGDDILKQLGIIIETNVRERDIVARLGADKFAVLMENCSYLEAEDILENIVDEIKHNKFNSDDKLFRITVTIGVVTIDEHALDADSAIALTEQTLYTAKSLGRDRIYKYDEGDAEIISHRDRIKTLSDLSSALEIGQFELYAQKIEPINVCDSKPIFECLVRMKGESDEAVVPGEWLSTLEHYLMAPQLDHWVIENALQWAHMKNGFLDGIKHLAINLSGQTLSNEGILNHISNCLNKYNIPAHKICFEVTETAAISVLSDAIHFLNELKSFKCKVALDDFGTGFSSFRYLRDLPIDYVKIDGVFIKNITLNNRDYTLTKGIHELVNAMGMETVAEFVESEEIYKSVKDLGINYAQGLYIQEPQNIDKLILD
jgi:diguanylate cyclase (GGDEF)-like protein/PAS domain S-box-containing protein